MRFHVLGLGPVGQLVAFNLRKTLPPRHAVSLMFKSGSYANRLRDQPLKIEHEGVVDTAKGFETESTLKDRAEYREQQEAEELEQRQRRSSQTDRQHSELPASGPNRIESLFVCTKAQSTLQAIKQIQHRLSPASTIVLVQNGNLASHEQLVEKIFTDAQKRPNFILTSNTHGTWLKAPPFHVVHAGIGRLRFGIVPDGRRDFEKGLDVVEGKGKPRLALDDIALSKGDPEIARYRSLRNTVAVLQKMSGLHASWDAFADIQILLRQKLAVNCVINPLTAILGCRNGVLFEDPAADRLAFRICKEAALVFKQEAIHNRRPDTPVDEVSIPEELSAQALYKECKRLAGLTAGNVSSMLADIRKGDRATEIEYLNGYLMSLASRYDEEVKLNASLLDLVKLRCSIPLDTMI